MLEIGRVILLDPEIILFDEPTAGLAPKVIDQVFEKLKQINQAGVTLLMVEKNVRKALDISGYVYVLADGKNEFEGKPKEVLDNA